MKNTPHLHTSPALLGVAALADRLSVSQRTVWRLAARGVLPPAVRLGACTRWRASDIAEWIARSANARELSESSAADRDTADATARKEASRET